MSDNRRIDELSLEELESLVERRKRIERARRFAEASPGQLFRPVTVLPPEQGGTRTLKKKNRLRDRLLLFIEVVALLALISVTVNSLFSLENLNQAVQQVRAATPISTQNAVDQELPASSFPPSSSVSELPGSSFPPEPAPPALGIRLQAVASVPIPTPGPRSPTRIVIPAINLDWPVVEGDGWEELKQGIGHRVGSSNPGERGNLVLSGHNDVYGEPFRDLEILEVGKDVLVYSGGNAFRYVIKAKRVVSPNDLSVLAPSRNPIITLITCTPYRVDTMRLIVIGELAP